MNEWTNGHRLMAAIYNDTNRHEWTVNEYRWDGSAWRKTGKYWTFETLEEVKAHIKKELF